MVVKYASLRTIVLNLFFLWSSERLLEDCVCAQLHVYSSSVLYFINNDIYPLIFSGHLLKEDTCRYV